MSEDQSAPPPGCHIEQSQNLRAPWTCVYTGWCTHPAETEAEAVEDGWRQFKGNLEDHQAAFRAGEKAGLERATNVTGACEALLRTLLASNGWIISHDAPTGRSTIVFCAIPDDALEETSVGNRLARVQSLLFPKGVPRDS